MMGTGELPLARLLSIMARLRDPDLGCPWDVEQTFATIAPYTIEEAYEVADAIEREDVAALRDELGDLLLQVVFHARIAEEGELFTFADVAQQIGDKLVRRHPHVFADTPRETGHAAWEAIKSEERGAAGATSALDGVAIALPALMRAEKLQKRAARVGFDWPDQTGPLAKISEELGELASAPDQDAREDEMGDLLFTVVNLARHLEVDPEVALRRASAKFERRFRHMESEGPLQSLALDELEARWQRAKRSPI